MIDVTSDDTKTFVWGAMTYLISGSGTINLYGVGASSLSDAAVAAANSLYRSTSGYQVGARIDLFADQNCPGSTPDNTSGCAIGSQVFLGPNNDGLPRSGFKVVVHHELGHVVQNGLFGTLSTDYGMNASQAACKCDHVEASNQSHCLQSREAIGAAQGEGWGQFYAAHNLNVGSQNNCTFAYYKELRNDDGTITQPPMAKSCFSQVRWMEGHCTASGRGTEWDWMSFYWRLRNKDSFTYTNLGSVYEEACGGTCVSANPSWSTLEASANTVFGPTSAKALAWKNQGENFGVDH